MFANRLVRGTGAAVNVELGFVPDCCMLWNLTDGDIVTVGHPSRDIFAFTSGGTNTPAVGNKLKGATSGATAIIADIITNSGTWAGGDAAGWIVLDQSSRVGTFTGGELLYNLTQQATAGVDDLTMTAADLVIGEKIDTAAATVTTTSLITAYFGDATHAPGVTIGSVISEANKLLHLVAFRSASGASGLRCPNPSTA